MPSFLSKLLGRKKGQEPDSPSDKRSSPTLLDGKFEAVSPTVSPSAALFSDPTVAQIRGNDKAKDKESPFNLLRLKSRPSSDSPTTEKPATDVPHLSLTLPVTKDRGRTLDVVFEPGREDAAIREMRLSPNEALSLVRTCSQVIIERGLETLGIMHPHWYSTSLEVQHRLISLYILSLASNSAASAASPTSPSTSATFESELHYAHSPHDVAAVLRWGLRHLKLDGASFGKESGDWTWYNTFVAAERTGSFPSESFSKSLIPQLPPTHAELLLATLDIISSLSALGEANGCSGSRLSRFFGLWLLTAEHSLEGDDWTTFYDRWDCSGRILEHLFLARIRDEAHNLPRRLTELVDQYPYASGADAWNDNLLPRPPFSTRDCDALFVRLDTEYTGALKPKSHTLRLIADALRAQSAAESAAVEDADLWDTIKKASLILDTPESPSDLAHTEPILNFSNIFSDETIRLLSLIPVDVSEKSRPTPTFVLLSPLSPGRPRSFSFPDSPRSPSQADNGRASSSGPPAAIPSLNTNPNTAPTTAAPVTPTDWLQFTNKGFGTISPTRDLVATLWDNDVEVTAPAPAPAPLSRKSSRRAHSRRSSVDSPSAQTHVSSLPSVSPPPTSKATLITRVKLNEAFVDFWSDALLDPISKPWLRFVLCQLKPLPSVVTSPNPTPTWLIIEQRFVRPAPVLPPKEEVEPPTPTTPPRPRASSPRPSLRAETSRLSAAFSFSPKMRFGFFTGGSGDSKSPNEKPARLSQVGELGESAKETRDAVAAVGKPKESDAGTKDDVGGDVASAAATTGAVAVATASAVAVAAVEEIPLAPSTEDASPPLAGETAPSISTKVDEPVGDQSTTTATSQNAPDTLIEERRTPVPVSNGGVHSTTTNEPAAAQTESSVLEVKPSEPVAESVPPTPYLAGISEGPIPQPEFVPAAAEITPPSDEVSAPPEATPVAEESSTVPLAEASRTTDTVVPPASSDSTSPVSGAIDEVVDAPAAGLEETQAAQPTFKVAVPMVEEAPSAERPALISEAVSAPANERALTDEPSSLDKDGIDVTPIVVGSAETVFVAEESVGSSVLKPTLEGPEHIMTKSEYERSAAEPEIRPSIMHDSEEPLHSNDSVQHVIEEPTTTNARVDESVVSRPAVVDSVEEPLANTSEPEPLVEGAATPAQETVPIVEESARPTVVKVETSPAVDEPDLSDADAPVNIDASTEASALMADPVPTADTAAADALAEPPAPAVEEPLPSASAEVISETSIPVPAENEPLFVFEAAPSAETPIETLTPVIDEPRPAPQTDSLITAGIPVGTSAEEPVYVATEVTPTAEVPVASPPATGELDPTPQESASGEEGPVEIPVAAFEEPIPVAEADTLPAEVVAEVQATATDESIPVSHESTLADAGALVEVPAPTTEHLAPADEEAASPMETSAFAEEESHLVDKAIPTAGTPVDTAVPQVEQSILVTDEAVHDTETPAAEIRAPATEEPDHISQPAAPIPTEPEVLTETLVPAAEEQTAVTEETAPAADTRTENLTLVVEEATPTPADFPTETPVPVAEEPALTPEVAPNADYSTETPAVTAEAIPNVIEAPPTSSETAVHIQAHELSEPTSTPETASHSEAPSLATEAPAAPIPEERSLAIEDAAEAPVSPPSETCVPPVPEESVPANTEAVPEVDIAPVAEDPVPVSPDTPSDVPVPDADEPAPTLGRSVSPVAEVPASVSDEPALVPGEEAVPAIIEHPAETPVPVAGESTAPTIEQAAPTIEDSTLIPPAETPTLLPEEPAPVPEESAPEASHPTPDADQPLPREESAERSTEEQAPSAEKPISDQPQIVVSESLQATEQVVQEPSLPVHEGAPAATPEEPAVQEPESIPASEMDAHAEESNGDGAHHADPGHEPDQKPATELDPAVTNETLDGDA